MELVDKNDHMKYLGLGPGIFLIAVLFNMYILFIELLIWFFGKEMGCIFGGGLGVEI